jgi:hypothetical protein
MNLLKNKLNNGFEKISVITAEIDFHFCDFSVFWCVDFRRGKGYRKRFNQRMPAVLHPL